MGMISYVDIQERIIMRRKISIIAVVTAMATGFDAAADFNSFRTKLLDGVGIIELAGNALFTQNFTDADATYFNHHFSIVGNQHTLDGGGIYSGLLQSTAPGAMRSISVGNNLTMVNFFTTDNGAAINSHGGGGYSHLNIDNNTIFRNNESLGLGGAVYAEQFIKLTVTGGVISFENNRDGGGLNDIYLAAGTDMSINGNSGTIYFNSGIRSKDETVTMSKYGKSTIVFGADSQNSGYVGDFQHMVGAVNVYSDNFFMGNTDVADSATLRFFNTSMAGTLNMHGGSALSLRAATGTQFNTLTLNNYMSDGANLFVQTNGISSDVLKILDTASAGNTIVGMMTTTGFKNTLNHKVLVVDASDASIRDATFALKGGVLDAGPLNWYLVKKDDDNWYLVNGNGGITGDIECDEFGNCTTFNPKGRPGMSDTGNTVANVPAMHLAMIRAGMNELRVRLGDLRTDGGAGQPGVWTRGYARHMEVDEHINATVNLYGFEGGADFRVPAGDGRVYLGVMGGYQYSNDKRIRQSNAFDGSGKTSMPTIGLYATWLGQSGWFADATLRHFWANMSLTNITAGGHRVEYDANRNFYTASLEGGKQMFSVAPNWAQMRTGNSMFAWEPKAELRFAHSGRHSHRTNFADLITYGNTRSVETKIALQTTYLPSGRESTWRPFIELGLYNEWDGATKIDFQGVPMKSDVSGFGAEVTAGLNVGMSERSYMYFDAQYEYGQVFRAISGRLGIRYSFGGARRTSDATKIDEYKCNEPTKCVFISWPQTAIDEYKCNEPTKCVYM